ncbi:MAG: hypothetical protein IPG89_08235 [Bacteroidetes bacterium]|nr:hypothetical protein [Bacteroidota bacterium]
MKSIKDIFYFQEIAATLIITSALAGALTSCISTKQIGDLNMISTRNVETKTDYVLIRNYMGGTKRELKRSKAKDLKDAVNNLVKQTPGGEFVKNAKVYLVNGKYYAVEGDIWGIAQNINFRGFKVGDIVQYKGNKYTITELKNDKVCTIKDDNEKIREASYDDLKRID